MDLERWDLECREKSYSEERIFIKSDFEVLQLGVRFASSEVSKAAQPDMMEIQAV